MVPQTFVGIALYLAVLLGVCTSDCIKEGSSLDLSCLVPKTAFVTWSRNGVNVAENCDILKNYSTLYTYPNACPISGDLQNYDLRIVAFNSSYDLGTWMCSYTYGMANSGYQSQKFTKNSMCFNHSRWWIYAILVAVVIALIVGLVVGLLRLRKRRRLARGYQSI